MEGFRVRQNWCPAIAIKARSEVDTDLAANDKGVINLSGPTWSHDILKVRLKEDGVLAKISTIRPLRKRFRSFERRRVGLTVARVLEHPAGRC